MIKLTKDQIEYEISILDEVIQKGLLANESYQETAEGIKNVEEMNKLLEQLNSISVPNYMD